MLSKPVTPEPDYSPPNFNEINELKKGFKLFEKYIKARGFHPFIVVSLRWYIDCIKLYTSSSSSYKKQLEQYHRKLKSNPLDQDVKNEIVKAERSIDENNALALNMVERLHEMQCCVSKEDVITAVSNSPWNYGSSPEELIMIFVIARR